MTLIISALVANLLAQALPYSPPAQGAPARAMPHDASPNARGPQRDEQEPVVAVRPAQAAPRSFWSRAKHAIGDTVSRLWEKDEPHATDGNLASLNGNVDEALKDYDESEKQLAPGSNAAAALAFDRSTAMLKGTPEQAKKALEEAQTARELGDAELRAKAAYNSGVALEAQGKPDEAIKAYANALSLDPDDVDSKVNLELLLQEHDKKQPQAGQQDQDKKQEPQKDQDKKDQQAQGDKQNEKKDEQKKDDQQGEQKKDEQAQQQKSDEKKEAKADEKKDEKGQRGQEQDDKQDQEGEKKKEEQQQAQASLGRSEAQRLLDAAKAGEKNLQMWRFGKKSDPHKPRSSAEKDW